MLIENHTEFIDNSSIGIHAVSSDGIILYANMCELDVLGYTHSEYVGRHVEEFQLDADCLADMMERLSKFEKFKKTIQHGLKAKHEVKYIIYNSSVYEVDGEFKHTRCYGTEVEKAIYDVFLKHFACS